VGNEDQREPFQESMNFILEEVIFIPCWGGKSTRKTNRRLITAKHTETRRKPKIKEGRQNCFRIF
jgi:hypothetical protein